MKIKKLLESINIPEEKIKEIYQKAHIIENIKIIMENTEKFSKLHYSLACTAPRNCDLKTVCKLINDGVIRHEGMLRGIYSYMKQPQDETIEEFVNRNDYTLEQIKKTIESKAGMSKVEVLKEMKKIMPYVNFKQVMEIVESKEELFKNKKDNKDKEQSWGRNNNKDSDSIKDSKESEMGWIRKNNKDSDKQKTEETNSNKISNEINIKYKWLEEGLVSLLKTPQENIVNDKSILKGHLERTGGKVVTRFPPEPNGRLHIGHVKAINLNFLYAEKHGGMTYLRFDDTNPKNEREEFSASIIEDIEWLGFSPNRITASSDYNDEMNACLAVLIKEGLAYCCHCSMEDIRTRRQVFQKEKDGGFSDSRILSPYRERNAIENLAVFERMMRGEIKEGQAVVRFKMDLTSGNPLMLDLVAARICDVVHPIKKRNFHVYPTYEFALCYADSKEDVTHSFCSREFKTRQESYHWVLRNLGLYEPVQWEFSKLVLSNTVLSKRRMKAIVESHDLEWDDPRLFTICGMRRRGFPPAAINKFVCNVGITYSETIIDVKILESYVRNELQTTAKKVFCIKNPLEMRISNLTKREICLAIGEEPVIVQKVVFIDSSDFSEGLANDFYRLTPTQPVGLLGIGCVRFTGFSGKVINCELCEEKPKKYIHWVPDLTNKITIKWYKPLFNSFASSQEEDYNKNINLNSLEILEGYCDKRIKGAKKLDRFQFVRMGFFCCDRTSQEGNLVFNLTLSLKNIH